MDPLSDPDLGNFNYLVDPLGQTYQQTANGVVTSFYFDALGRMKQGEAGAAEDAAKSWTAVKESCTACHKVYRN